MSKTIISAPTGKLPSNYSEGKFYLTINAHGLVSLWDTERGARKAALNGEEVYVDFQLTAEQRELLDTAVNAAVPQKRGRK